MQKVVIPIPRRDFDPTECAVPWKILKTAGVEVSFATPDGLAGECDWRMLTGRGLGPLSGFLAADKKARHAYHEMTFTDSFLKPLSWYDLKPDAFDGVLLPGGHAPGMREYLEAEILQKFVASVYEMQKPVGAICHGVVLAARAKTAAKKSLLFGHKVTSLLASQELMAWALTFLWLGNYYRTYSVTVESEVRSVLADKNDFKSGSLPLFRDSAENLAAGFCVQDGNLLTARWPGDAHQFGQQFLKLLKKKI